MIPIQLEGAMNFGKPKDWNDARDGVCKTLPVVPNARGLTSVWTFSDSERADIARGQNLSLFIAGHSHPVVMLSVVDIQGAAAPGFEPARSTADRYVYSSPDAA